MLVFMPAFVYYFSYLMQRDLEFQCVVIVIVVGVVAVFFSPHFMFAFAFVSSHMLWERNIHTNAKNHQTVPTDFHGDRKREERFLFETQSNQFYRCKNNIFTIAFYLNLSLFICHRLFVIHISTDRTDEREKKPDTYGFFHQINKYDPKNKFFVPTKC